VGAESPEPDSYYTRDAYAPQSSQKKESAERIYFLALISDSLSLSG
jgi:hypothetical protein